MKDGAEGKPLSGKQRTDPVPKIGPVISSGTLGRTVARSDDNSLALFETDGVPDRLGARLLLDKQQFASCELLVRAAETGDYLKREEQFAVEILMKTVEIARDVMQEQGSGSHLSRRMTLREERIQRIRILRRKAQGSHPGGRNGCQQRIEFPAEFIHARRQGIGEVLVFTASETVAGHVDAGTEEVWLGIEGACTFAFLTRKEHSDPGVTVRPDAVNGLHASILAQAASRVLSVCCF